MSSHHMCPQTFGLIVAVHASRFEKIVVCSESLIQLVKEFTQFASWAICAVQQEIVLTMVCLNIHTENFCECQ